MNNDTSKVLHWTEWNTGKKRKFLKHLHPLMLAEKGYTTIEGTNPHGKKSRGYGKGTGLPGTSVLWDKQYVIEKLKYDLRPLSVSDKFKDFFIEFLTLSLEIDFIPKNESVSLESNVDFLAKLTELLTPYEESIGDKIDSPRNKKCHQLIQDLRGLISESQSND